MKPKALHQLGVPKDPATTKTAGRAVSDASRQGMGPRQIKQTLREVIADPDLFTEDPVFGRLAQALAVRRKNAISSGERDTPAPYTSWGTNLDANAVQQMENACRLPISLAGALLPDAHMGYGLPIGGVLAVNNAVIPYAVGVDIACRMRMSVLDMPPDTLDTHQQRFIQALDKETRFGVGASFSTPRKHKVLDEDWGFSTVTRRVKDKAYAQLGTSGSGNHFAEFGLLTLDHDDLGLTAGTYLALLTHSGSRGPGNETASHFSRLAMDLRPDLPRELRHLAWFEMDSAEGREYWEAMQLMGRFAAANHELIHHYVTAHLGVDVLAMVENHHNFAWIEKHKGRDAVIHRKGATPAWTDELGVIPGSMATPGFVVRGKGNPKSLHSASHGAGRVMSRKAAKKAFTWNQVSDLLRQSGVTVLAAGLDEAPMAYKDIHQVMAAQTDLVNTIARFDPKLVRMDR